MKESIRMSQKAILSLMILALFVLLASCQGEGGKSDVNVATEVSLVQVDSIMIDLRGDLKIYDYNEATGLFLGGDIGSLGMAMMPPGGPVSFNQIGHVVIQKDGKVLHQFKHFDDGPEGHGNGALNSFFIGNDKIGVMGNKGLFVYALDGTFLTKYKDFNTTMFLGMPEHKVAVTNAEGMMAIGFPRRNDDTYDRFDSVYQIVEPFHFYGLNDPKLDEGGMDAGLVASYPFPEAEVYTPGFNMLKATTAPHVSMSAKRNEVSVLYQEQPVLEQYDMTSGKLLRKVDLSPDHFRAPQQMKVEPGEPAWYDWVNNGGWYDNAYYRDLVELGDYSLLRYVPALPKREVDALLASGGTYNNPVWPSIKRKYFNSYYQLIKYGEKVVPDFNIPVFEPQEGQLFFRSRTKVHGQIIGGSGLDRIYVYASNDEDIERDYELIRVYKLVIK